MEKNVRLRLLYVMELLFEQTDTEHGVTMQGILKWLEEHNISGERKSVYEDIKALKEYGLTIEYFKEDKTYRLVKRSIETEELLWIMKALKEYKDITEDQRNTIIDKMMNMISCYQRQKM